ncbi:MAG: DnaJ domain-containing protein [Myxococcota bacterium]|nr:DnaJ domain-containing protein [Myxococcota bacterium]
MTPDKDLQPVAIGHFSQRPFPHILVFLWERRMGGTLNIDDGADQVSIFFRDGSPAKISSTRAGRGLGHVLRLNNVINDEQLEAAEAEIEQHGGVLGQVLIEQQTIDPSTLVRALREQMLLKLIDVFAMTDGSYAFYEAVDLLGGLGTSELFPVDPYPVLMAGMRTHGYKLNFAHACARLEGKWLSASDPKTIRRFRLTNAEKPILETLLSGAVAYSELISNRQFEMHAVMYILYVLMMTHLLKAEDAAPDQPVSETPALNTSQLDSVSPAPYKTPLDPQTMEKKQQILDKAAHIGSQNYYEMLEIPFGAPHEDVRTAFFRLAKVFHPDKVPKVIARELKDAVQYIFSNLSEAHATLIDPDAREEYESAIRDSEKRTSSVPIPDDEDVVREVLQAETFFQKALVFLKRGQTDKAMNMIERARALNPQEGEYIAIWAHLMGKQRPSTEGVEDLVGALREAATSYPKSERAHLYLAQMLMRAGHQNEAQRHFGRVLELNPRNIEAARELRLMEMRGKKTKETASGLFKRLFKRSSSP